MVMVAGREVHHSENHAEQPDARLHGAGFVVRCHRSCGTEPILYV